MTAYFTASIVGKKMFLDKYLAVLEVFAKRGIDVASDHIIKTTPEQIRLETRAERDAFHKSLEAAISNCRFLIVEASFPSISVGYEISLALRHKKPVLVLYSEGDAPSLFAEHLEDKLVCEHYTLDTLSSIVDGFLSFIEDTSDSRFTFFITPQIAKHLEQKAHQTRVPKAVYLRRLIETDMQNYP